MKCLRVICLMIFFAGGFFASGLYAIDSFLGLGAEVNMNTREGAAAGGSLTFGIDLNTLFALGVKVAYSYNFDTVSNLESYAFFRWYPLTQNVSLEGFFAQAEAGGSFFFEDGNTFPAFLGGLAAGWRFNFGEQFYIEPLVRGGYPFMWGAGLTAGIRIKIKTETEKAGENIQYSDEDSDESYRSEVLIIDNTGESDD